MDAEGNDVITIDGSSDSATIKFTDYGGTEKTINFGYDNNTASASVAVHLMDSNGYVYIIAENHSIMYKDYVILDQADDTHLLQLSNVPGGRIKTTDILRFTDQFSGTLYEHTFTSSEIGVVDGTTAGANVSMRIGSQDYYVTVYNASTKANSYVKITWNDANAVSTDSGAGYAGVTGNTVLFPQIKGENGEYIIFVHNRTSLSNSTTVIVPSAGTTKGSQWVSNESSATTFLAGKLNYTYKVAGADGTVPVSVVPTPLSEYRAGIMILEEERADNNYYAIYIGITETGTTTKTVKVDTPRFSVAYDPATDIGTRQTSDLSPQFTTWGSDTYYSSAIDQWGAVVQYYNKDEGSAMITYPDTQLYADLFILAEGAITSTTATGAGTVKQSVPISDSVSKLDTDIPSPDTVDENLILVGGSCVNDLVQKLVDDGDLDAKYTCTGGAGEGWEEGKGYIWLIEDAFKTGQTVLVVAGTKAADTRTATSVLQKYDTLLTDSTATAIAITSATTAGITPM